MLPWCSSTIFLTVARPRPVPERFVVKNGSKTLSTCSGGIGAPLFLDQDLNFQVFADPLVTHGDRQLCRPESWPRSHF